MNRIVATACIQVSDCGSAADVEGIISIAKCDVDHLKLRVVDCTRHEPTLKCISRDGATHICVDSRVVEIECVGISGSLFVVRNRDDLNIC